MSNSKLFWCASIWLPARAVNLLYATLMFPNYSPEPFLKCLRSSKYIIFSFCNHIFFLNLRIKSVSTGRINKSAFIQVGFQTWGERPCTYLSCPRRTLFRSSFTCISSTITSSFSTVTNNSMILSCIIRQVLYNFCPTQRKEKKLKTLTVVSQCVSSGDEW